jgi:bacteriocin biosynthesis cyclodehydratase domain-containing protein
MSIAPPRPFLPVHPRLKEVFGTLMLPGRIRLGGAFGYASEIEDPAGNYACLLECLDGHHDLEKLIDALGTRLTRDEIVDALGVLVEAGYVEDADVVAPKILSLDDLQRYKANINFFNTLPGTASKFERQAQLKQTTGFLFGLGGIGSNVCTALAELGIGRMVAVDFDRVELSNLNRQVLYSTPAVGRSKAEVATARIREFNPDIQFVAHDQRITSLDDVREVLDESVPDFVVNLADKPNGYIDHWVNRACVERDMPLFAAGIHCGVGTAYSVDAPGTSACYACRVSAELAATPALAEELEYIRTSDHNHANGALGLTCMLQAYIVASEILRHLLGVATPLTRDRTLEVDFLTFEQTWHTFPRRADCEVCGTGADR